MSAARYIIWGVWIVYLLVWIIAAPTAKRTLDRDRQARLFFGVRLALAAGVIAMLGSPSLRHTLVRIAPSFRTQNLAIATAGDLLGILGIALACWARFTLGRNWGMPMSHVENAQLVTCGPYATIRHPIYSCILLVILGSALASNYLWLVPFLLAGVQFLYSARREEARMAQLFPGEYPGYVQRTKMLVPGIL